MRLLLFIVFTLFTEPFMATNISRHWTRHFDHNNGGINDNVYLIQQDKEGIIWLSTYGGLFSYDGNKFLCHKDSLPTPPRKGYHWVPTTPLEQQIQNESQKEVKERIFCSMYDKDGNLWIGRTDGLWLYGNTEYPFDFTNIGEEVLCLFVDSHNRLLMTTRQGTVALLGNDLLPISFLAADGTWKREKTSCGFVVTDIKEDKQQRLWLAARKHGLLKLTPRGGMNNGYDIYQYRNIAGGKSRHLLDNVYALHFDSQGRLWTVSLDTGLGFIADTENNSDKTVKNCSTVVGGKNGESLKQRFRCFLPLQSEKWLLGSDSGLLFINPLTWKSGSKGTWKKVETFCQGKRQGKVFSVQYLTADLDGNIYGATSGDGLLEINNLDTSAGKCSATLFTQEEGMVPSNVIYSMACGRNGDIWGFSEGGIFRIPRQMQKQQASDALLPKTVACFSPEDIYPKQKMSIGNAVVLNDGRILKGTDEGIISFFPDKITERTTNKNLHLRVRYVFNGRKHDCLAEDTLRLPKGVTECTLYMSITDYNKLSKTRYAVMRHPEYSKWTFVASDTFLVRNLSDGHTTLNIRATDTSGSWAENGRRIVIIAEKDFSTALAVAAFVAMAALSLTVWRKKRSRRFMKHCAALAGIKDGIPTQQERDDAFRQKVEEMVVRNLSDSDYNTESLARDMGMTKTTLLSNIKTVFGISPTELMNRIRIQAAEELLTKTDLSVSEVAYRTGYNDPKYFSRVYKKFFGCTPSETRTKSRKL